ncbi:MAG: hypothetical protein R2932_58740 [Caldilineaceae bacterium]
MCRSTGPFLRAFGDAALTAKLCARCNSHNGDSMTQTTTPSDNAAVSSAAICDYALLADDDSGVRPLHR